MACLVGLLVNVSTAQAERQRPPEESCAEGYYNGPRAGRKSYSNDKYLWVVTEDFAKRFCMPPEFVDKGLKGAEAIAFRMSKSWHIADDRCAVIDGKEACTGEDEILFDIYFRSDLNLPAANPDVKFYDGILDDAGGHISFGVKARTDSPGSRYRSGEYQPPPGTIPHFQNPFNHPNSGNTFALIGVHEGKGAWPIAALREYGYRANWRTGLDFVRVQGSTTGFYNPRREALGIRQFVIILDRPPDDDTRDDPKDSEKRVPEDYEHVIWLPEKFFEKVRAGASAKNWLEKLRPFQAP